MKEKNPPRNWTVEEVKRFMCAAYDDGFVAGMRTMGEILEAGEDYIKGGLLSRKKLKDYNPSLDTYDFGD